MTNVTKWVVGVAVVVLVIIGIVVESLELASMFRFMFDSLWNSLKNIDVITR